jgi:hypothetical protein
MLTAQASPARLPRRGRPMRNNGKPGNSASQELSGQDFKRTCWRKSPFSPTENSKIASETLWTLNVILSSLTLVFIIAKVPIDLEICP